MAPIELLQKKKIGGKDVKRDRVLSIVELADLVTQLPPANLHKGTVLGLWLILSTGCRVGELMGAVWVDANPSRLQRSGVKRAFAIPPQLHSKRSSRTTSVLSSGRLRSSLVKPVQFTCHRRCPDALNTDATDLDRAA